MKPCSMNDSSKLLFSDIASRMIFIIEAWKPCIAYSGTSLKFGYLKIDMIESMRVGGLSGSFKTSQESAFTILYACLPAFAWRSNLESSSTNLYIAASSEFD